MAVMSYGILETGPTTAAVYSAVAICSAKSGQSGAVGKNVRMCAVLWNTRLKPYRYYTRRVARVERKYVCLYSKTDDFEKCFEIRTWERLPINYSGNNPIWSERGIATSLRRIGRWKGYRVTTCDRTEHPSYFRSKGKTRGFRGISIFFSSIKKLSGSLSVFIHSLFLCLKLYFYFVLNFY